LKEYYKRHIYGTVTTADFIDAMESVSGRELDPFFGAWLHGTGWPVFEVSSYYEKKGGELKAIVTVRQAQEGEYLYAMTLPIDPDGDGSARTKRIEVSGRWFQFEAGVERRSGAAKIIENDWLLMETRSGDYPEPAVKRVKKHRLRAGASATVTVVGENFTPATRVRLSNKKIDIKSVQVDETGRKIYLELEVPAFHKAKKVNLTIINPDGDRAVVKGALEVLPGRS